MKEFKAVCSGCGSSVPHDVSKCCAEIDALISEATKDCFTPDECAWAEDREEYWRRVQERERAIARAAIAYQEERHSERTFQLWMDKVHEQRAEFDKIARSKLARELLTLWDGDRFGEMRDKLREIAEAKE